MAQASSPSTATEDSPRSDVSTPIRPSQPMRWPFWLLGAWFVLSIVYLKVYWHARSSFLEAERQAKAGHLLVAVRHYGQTIRWYTPGSRYVTVAVQRLHQIGVHAFRRGDWEQAIISFQHLRNGLSSVRGFYQPHRAALLRCEKELSVVLSHLPGHSKAKTTKRTERQALIAASLAKDERPSVWLSCLVVVCYLLWLWLAARLCWRWSFLGWSRRAVEGGLALLCSVLWLCGLSWV